MKVNFWNPLIIVIGIVFIVLIICETIKRIKQAEFSHLEAMADKAMTLEGLKQQIPPSIERRGFLQSLAQGIRNVLLELCPVVARKLLGL